MYVPLSRNNKPQVVTEPQPLTGLMLLNKRYSHMARDVTAATEDKYR